MSRENGYRSWKSFLESDDTRMEAVWAKSVVQLAVLIADEEESGLDIEFDDPIEIFETATSDRKLLPWWPEELSRIHIKITCSPDNGSSETYGPSPVHLNSSDLGRSMFINSMCSLLEAEGDEFSGTIQVKIMRASDKRALGGWKGSDITIGKASKKKKKSEDTIDGAPEMLEYLTGQLKGKDAMMERMFSASASVISSSSALVHAARGVNPGAPWMQDGSDANPMWMALLQGALGIGGAFLSGKNPSEQIKEMMNTPVHPMLGDGNPNPRALPDNGGQPQYGSDQFLEQGVFDGFQVLDADVLDDEFEEDPYSQMNDLEDMDVDDDLDEDSDEEEEEDDDEEEEEEEEERPRKKKAPATNADPFAGKSFDEVERMLNRYIDKMPESEKPKLKQAGVRLAGKIMKS